MMYRTGRRFRAKVPRFDKEASNLSSIASLGVVLFFFFVAILWIKYVKNSENISNLKEKRKTLKQSRKRRAKNKVLQFERSYVEDNKDVLGKTKESEVILEKGANTAENVKIVLPIFEKKETVDDREDAIAVATAKTTVIATDKTAKKLDSPLALKAEESTGPEQKRVHANPITNKVFQTDRQISDSYVPAKKVFEKWEFCDDVVEVNLDSADVKTRFTPEEMFRLNKTVISDYRDDLSQYSTKLNKENLTKEQIMFAEQKAKEIITDAKTKARRKPANTPKDSVTNKTFQTDSETSKNHISAEKVFKAVKTEKSIEPEQKSHNVKPVANTAFQTDKQISETYVPTEKVFKKWECHDVVEVNLDYSDSKTRFTPDEMFELNKTVISDYRDDLSQYSTKLNKENLTKEQIMFAEQKAKEIVTDAKTKARRKPANTPKDPVAKKTFQSDSEIKKNHISAEKVFQSVKTEKSTEPEQKSYNVKPVANKAFLTDKQISETYVPSEKVFKKWECHDVVEVNLDHGDSKTRFTPEEMFKLNKTIVSDYRDDLSQYSTKLNKEKLTKEQIMFAEQKAKEIVTDAKTKVTRKPANTPNDSVTNKTFQTDSEIKKNHITAEKVFEAVKAEKGSEQDKKSHNVKPVVNKAFQTDKQISETYVPTEKVFKKWECHDVVEVNLDHGDSKSWFTPEQMFELNKTVISDYRDDLSQYSTELNQNNLTKEQIMFAEQKAKEIITDDKRRRKPATAPEKQVVNKVFQTDGEISKKYIPVKKIFKEWEDPFLVLMDDRLEKTSSRQTRFTPEEMFRLNKIKSDFREDLSQYTTELRKERLSNQQIVFAAKKATEISQESRGRRGHTKRSV